MANILGALGALGSGFAGGMLQGRAEQRRQADADFEAKQRERLTRMQAEADAERDLTKQANSAFAASPAISGLQPGQQPDPAALAEAYRARGEVFRSGGRGDLLMKNYAEALPYYTANRNRVIDRAMAQYDADGDPVGLASAVYPQLFDGKSITMAKRLGDGSIQFSLSDGGKFAATPDKIVGMVRRLRMDPALAAKFEYESLKSGLDTQREVTVEKTKGQEARATEGVKNQGRQSLEGTKHTYSLGEIAARGAQDRSTAQFNDQLTRTRPYTLGDGGERFIDVRQPDGSLKPTRIATNPKDGSARVTTAKQINDMVINNYGVLDVGTGKQVGSADTQRLSAAAERLMADNPGLQANEAINEAAKDLGLGLVPKKQ